MISNNFNRFQIIGLCMTLLLGGCATPQIALDAKGTGVVKVYDKPKPVVWTAMKKAVRGTGGAIAVENEKDCEIAAKYGVTAFSWGERVGLFCRSLSADRTEIEVVSKPAISVNITARDWTSEIYEALDTELR